MYTTRMFGFVAMLFGIVWETNVYSQTAAAIRGQGTMHWISDIHFDPFYGNRILELANDNKDGWRDHTEWPAILKAVTGNDRCSTGGEDTNDFLLRTVMKRAATVVGETKPDLLLLTGDFLSHDFTDRYFNSFDLPSDLLKVEQHNSFVQQTMAYVAMTISQAYGDIPIVAVLGNNDAFCGDYGIRGDSGYLSTTRETFRKYFLPGLSDDFEKYGGCYATSVPGTKHQIVVLNTIPFMARYPDMWFVQHSKLQTSACDAKLRIELSDEFEWLERSIESLPEEGKAWIACHVPPGVDCFKPQQYWNRIVTTKTSRPMFVHPFREFFLSQRERMAGMLAGHSHMAEFKLIRDGDGTGPAVSSVLMAPSISPVHKNNASFRVMTFDIDTLAVADYVTHWLSDSAAAPPTWGEPFSFTQTYGKKDVSPASLQSLYNDMGAADGKVRTQYFFDYTTRHSVPPERVQGNYDLAIPTILGP